MDALAARTREVFADANDPGTPDRWPDAASTKTRNGIRASDAGLSGDTDAPDKPPAPGTHLGGTGRLIAGARLPMLPPPRIRMPDHHLTLDPWAETSDHTYPPLHRRPRVITLT